MPLCVNSQIPRQVQCSIRYYLKAGACWSRSRWQSKMHGQLKERLFCQFWQTIKRSCKRDKAWIGKFMLLLALFVTSWSAFIRLSFRPPAPKSRPPVHCAHCTFTAVHAQCAHTMYSLGEHVKKNVFFWALPKNMLERTNVPWTLFFALFTQSCIGCELKSWLLMWASAVPTSEEESQQHITGYQCNLHGGQELG